MRQAAIDGRLARVSPDRWSRWVLGRRYGGSAAARAQTDRFLQPIRAHVLALADLHEGDVVVDIASRDGFLGLGALEAVGAAGQVVFTESSPALLEVCREQVQALGASQRCRFLQAEPDRLPELGDGCADAVTMRSILNYVPDKRATLAEYHRLLRPGGRLAFIQMFPRPPEPDILLGYDVAAVAPLALRVRQVMEAAKPLTYTDFDERDLLTWLREAGFRRIDLHFEVEIADRSDWPVPDWEVAKDIAAGADQPTLAEAITEALPPDEAAQFIAHIRPQVEQSLRSVYFRKAFVGAVRARGACPDANPTPSRHPA